MSLLFTRPENQAKKERFHRETYYEETYLLFILAGLQEKTDQLSYARNYPSRPLITKTIEDIIIISEIIPNSAQNLVSC